jgi:hypothetical protein
MAWLALDVIKLMKIAQSFQVVPRSRHIVCTYFIPLPF